MLILDLIFSHKSEISFGISEVVASISVVIAIISLLFAVFSYFERRKSEKEKEELKQQLALKSALLGNKEDVAFIALELTRFPKKLTDENSNELLSALCLAFVFAKSSRTRALVLKTILNMSKDKRKNAFEIFDELLDDFKIYQDAKIECTPNKKEDESLEKYIERIENLKTYLENQAKPLQHLS